MGQVAWLEKVAKIEADIKRRTARARVLEDKVAHLNVAEAEEEDASDDEEEDKGGGGQSAVKKSAAEDRLTLKLEQDLQNENSALQKARELLDEIKGKEPKPTDETLDEDAERARILARQAATKRAPGEHVLAVMIKDDTRGMRAREAHMHAAGGRVQAMLVRELIRSTTP
jgi:hypothetical protein